MINFHFKLIFFKIIIVLKLDFFAWKKKLFLVIRTLRSVPPVGCLKTSSTGCNVKCIAPGSFDPNSCVLTLQLCICSAIEFNFSSIVRENNLIDFLNWIYWNWIGFRVNFRFNYNAIEFNWFFELNLLKFDLNLS